MLTKWGLYASKFLGLSKAGGVVFHTKVSQLKNRNAQRVANLEGVENSRVSLLMVYSIDSVSEENHRVLIYQGENAKEQVIGIVLITGWGVNLVVRKNCTHASNQTLIVKFFVWISYRERSWRTRIPSKYGLDTKRPGAVDSIHVSSVSTSGCCKNQRKQYTLDTASYW